MRAVNLLPRDEQRVPLEGVRTPLLAAAGGVVVVTAAAIFLSFSASGTVEDRRAEVAAVEAEIAAVPTAPSSEVSQGTLVRERSERVAALSAALTNRVAFDRLLRELSYVFPDDAWLTQLEATAPEPETPGDEDAAPPPQATPTADAAGVTIQGATFTHDQVAVVLARLALVPSLEDVQLTSTSRVDPQVEAASRQSPNQPAAPTKPGRPFVSFVVSATLRTGAVR
jgi:Tfp pilus assembly protein PilN